MTVSAPATPVAVEEPKLQPKVVPFPKRDETAVPWRTQLARAAAAVAIPLTLGGAWLLSHPAGSDTMLGSNPLWNAAPVAATYAPAAHAALEVEEAMPPAEGLAEFVERTGWEGLLEFDVEAGVPKAGGLRVMVPSQRRPLSLSSLNLLRRSRKRLSSTSSSSSWAGPSLWKPTP